MEVLVINGHDYSKYVERKGYSWSRNDLDSPNSGRVKNGTMRRTKVAEKRSLKYNLVSIPQPELAQLDTDIRENTYQMTYEDLHGVKTGTFYSSSLSATLAQVSGGKKIWEGALFTATEV